MMCCFDLKIITLIKEITEQESAVTKYKVEIKLSSTLLLLASVRKDFNGGESKGCSFGQEDEE